MSTRSEFGRVGDGPKKGAAAKNMVLVRWNSSDGVEQSATVPLAQNSLAEMQAGISSAIDLPVKEFELR
jgi:hypothetical protein